MIPSPSQLELFTSAPVAAVKAIVDGARGAGYALRAVTEEGGEVRLLLFHVTAGSVRVRLCGQHVKVEPVKEVLAA